MTWITDDTGTRWVDPPPARQRRAFPKAVRFADVKVGDWLEGGPYEKFLARDVHKAAPIYSVVTDQWFDPVQGERNPEKGMLFAVARFRGLDRESGEPRFDHKYAHTRRGLASQGYRYSEAADPVATLKATFEGVQDGSVVLLSQANRKPKPRPIGLL